ncbi:MAG: sugar phosphate isomerase/epimerase family protein [Candidatus Omnitrophota bacterium]
MKSKIIMHVNYCEQGQTIPEICRKAVDWGFDGVEFRRKRGGVKESAEEYLDGIAGAAVKSKMKCVIFGAPGPNLLATDADERRRETEEVVEFYRLASERFKLSVCNTTAGALFNPDKNVPYEKYEMHGSQAATKEQWDWTVSGFKVLGGLAEKLGFQLAFETHMHYLHDRPQAAKKLADLIDSPAVGVNLDYENYLNFPDHLSIRETVEAMGDRLYYVHLKNSIPGGKGVRFRSGLEEGEINNREFLRILKEKDYQGHICIEAPRPGDREHYAQQDIAYLKSVIRDIK